MSLLEVKLAQFCSADLSNGDSFGCEIITPVAHKEVDSTSIANNEHDAIYLDLENFSVNYTSSFLDGNQPLSNFNINYPDVEGEMDKCMKAGPESQKAVTDHLHNRDNHLYSISLPTLTLDNRTKTDGQSAVAIACAICSYEFHEPNEMTEHMKTHDYPAWGEKSAGSSGNAGNVLTRHIKTNLCKKQSEVSAIQELTCDICNYKTETISGLKNHLLTHLTMKPFTCVICTRKFKTENHLERHKLIHMEVNPFSCEMCQLSFDTSLTYMRHRMLAHFGECPLKCDKCPASFVCRTSSKKHMEMTHSIGQPFACSKCSYTSKTLQCLQKHQVTHTEEERNFVCLMCSRTYKRSIDLKNHILKIHEGFKPHACPEEGCDFRTANLMHLKTHALTHSDLKLFHCNKCDFQTPRLTGLYRHKLTHTDRKPYKCPVCKFSCRAPRDLRRHIHTHLNNRSQCPLCEFTSESESSLVEHVVEHTPEMPYHCKFCNFSCLKIRELWEHRRVHKNPFVCSICHLTFRDKYDLTRHMKTNCKERSKTYGVQHFTCDICNFKTKTISRLENHMFRHMTEKPFACDICDRKFKSESHFRQHNLTHLDVNPFSCEICQLSFSTSQTYKRHRMSAHTGERPFRCDKCPASFVRSDCFRKHMEITHSTDRPFACSKCSYTSKTLKGLKLHQVTHTEERSFVCSMCPHTYKRSRDLKYHILKIHEGLKPYACPEEGCDYKTANLKPLKMHALTHSALKLFHCNKCDFQTTKLTGLYQHMLIHTDRKPHKCPLCEISYHKPKDLRRHIHTHLSNQSQCPLCEFTCESESSLVEHVVEHTPEKPHQCKFCSFSCLKIRELWEHRRVHKRPFACLICHLSFRDNYDLKRHMKTNCRKLSKTCDVQDFTCDICNHKTRTMSGLKKHLLTHMTEKRYKCSICSNSCKDSASLKIHISKFHEAMKLHACPQEDCEYRTGSLIELQKHAQTHSCLKLFPWNRADHKTARLTFQNEGMQTHTDTKPYKCPVCQLPCSTSSCLKQHIQSHLENKTQCPLCKYVSESNSLLIMHVLDHAQEKTNNSAELDSGESIGNGDEIDMPDNHDDVNSSSLRDDTHDAVYLNFQDISECNTSSVTDADQPLSNHSISYPEVEEEIGNCVKAAPESQRTMTNHIHSAQEKVTTPSVCPTQQKTTAYKADKTFICHICNYKTNQKARIQDHMIVHLPERPFTCDICNKAFKRKGDLKDHKVTHTNVKPFSCEICQVSFSNYRTYKGHKMGIHDGQRPYKCDKCSSSFISEDRRKRHIELSHSADRPFPCSQCNYSGKTIHYLKRHQLAHIKKKSFVCSMCPRSFNYSSLLERHILKIHKGIRSHACPQENCEYKAVNFRQLNAHLLTHSELKVFDCSKCDYKTTKLKCLRSHMKCHSDRKRIKCPICQQYFSCTLSKLKPHIGLHLRGKSQCPLCEFASDSESDLIMHVLEHTNERPYKCNICNFSCLSQVQFCKHKLVHKEERPFVCRICKRAFKRRYLLTEHLLFHIDKKPYKCNLCGQSFKKITTIKRHCMAHLTEQMYDCSICSHKCKDASELKNHKCWHRGHRSVRSCSKSGCKGRQAQDGPRRTHDLPHHKHMHTNSKPYECELCTFRSNNELESGRHMLQQHAERLSACVKCPYKTHNQNQLWAHMNEKKHGSNKSNMIATDHEDLQDSSQVSHPSSESDGSDTGIGNSQPDEDFEIVIEKDECMEDASSFQGVIVPNCSNPQSGSYNSDGDSHQNEDLKLLENSACPSMQTKEAGSCKMNRSLLDIRDHEESYSSSPACQPEIESCNSFENSHSGEDCKIIVKKEVCAEDAFGHQEMTNQHFHRFGAENQNSGYQPEEENQQSSYRPWTENQNSDHPLAENQSCDHYFWAEKQNFDHSRAQNQNHDYYPWTENQNSDEHPQPEIYDSEEQSQGSDSHEIIIMKRDQFGENVCNRQDMINSNFHNPVTEIHNSDGDCYQGEGTRITINPAYSKTCCILKTCSPIKSLMSSPGHENSLHLSGEDHNSNANSQLIGDHKVIIVKEEVDKDGHGCHETVTTS